VMALVPNRRGAEAALVAGVHKLTLPVSASEAHSLANVRKTREQMVAELREVIALRNERAPGVPVEVGLSTAFGCTLQGRVDEAEVLRLLRAALAAGADGVGLADTVGYADPEQVRRVFTRGREQVGERLDCGHFHDTRGLGLANVYAAWQTGVRRFDACLGGIGGCPHAPGASGNVATEDVAYLFASMGVATGVDFNALISLRAQLAQWLDGECLHGNIARAGLPRTLLETA
ncbi:MAG: hypothetical protein RJA10_1021, partial [Pseudomonadota bacterium]